MKITQELLEQYTQAEAKRKEFESQARPFAAESRRIAGLLLTALDEAESTTAKRGQFRVSIVEKPGRVKWREELVKQLGPERIADLQAAAPPSRSVTVSAA